MEGLAAGGVWFVFPSPPFVSSVYQLSIYLFVFLFGGIFSLSSVDAALLHCCMYAWVGWLGLPECLLWQLITKVWRGGAVPLPLLFYLRLLTFFRDLNPSAIALPHLLIS